jgi:hypothetical protein
MGRATTWKLEQAKGGIQQKKKSRRECMVGEVTGNLEWDGWGAEGRTGTPGDSNNHIELPRKSMYNALLEMEEGSEYTDGTNQNIC